MTWYLSEDPRLFCPARPPRGHHSPEALPTMRDYQRNQQICLYCDQPLVSTLIDGVFRYVVHEYLITEEPSLEECL